MAAPPNFNVKDKVFAITGVAYHENVTGIGFATAQLLVSQGAKVSFCDFADKPLQAAEAELSKNGGQVMAMKVDVRNRAQVEEWISKTVDKWGKLDGAANLAGVIPKGINVDRVEELKDDDWDFVIGVNLTGVMHCLRAEIQKIKEGGSIVNAASVAGVAGFAKNASYTAAKHGVVGLTRSAAKEVADRNVRVNAIAPGATDTGMLRASMGIRADSNGEDGEKANAEFYSSKIQRKGRPEEVAALIAWLLCDSSAYISGTVQVIDGCWMC